MQDDAYPTLPEDGIRGNGRHVLIILQSLPLPFDMRTWQQATELARNGYIVSVICPKSDNAGPLQEQVDNIRIFRHPAAFESKGVFGLLMGYISSLMWEFMLSYRVFFTVGFDVIQGCAPPDNLFLIGGFFKLFFGKKYLFDYRSVSPERYEARSGKRDLLYKIMCWWERMSFKTANITIVADEKCLQVATERGNKSPDTIFTLRTLPELSRLQNTAPMPSLKNGKAFLIASAGHIAHGEGTQHVIEAARLLVEKNKRNDIHFIIAGGGPALEACKKLAALEGLSDFITFTGDVPQEKLLAILSTADICINAAEENASADLLPMAIGKPVIRFGALPSSPGDVFLNARPGDSRDLSQKILLLLNDSERRARMGSAGRNYIENGYNWSSEAPKLLAAYDALFAGMAKR